MSTSNTKNTKLIKASPEKVYKAFTDPEALVSWMVADEMKGKVHHFDLKVGGGYEMSLFYPSTDKDSKGKTAEKEDRYTATFLELTPPNRIVQAIVFDSDDPAFAGEMTMEATLDAQGEDTNVTIAFKNIPSGIQPKDNEAGTKSSLEKLAKYVE